jgi:hypothetical protein
MQVIIMPKFKSILMPEFKKKPTTTIYSNFTNYPSIFSLQNQLCYHQLPSANVDAIKTTPCDKGTARGKDFYFEDTEKKFTKCRPCDDGTYQEMSGKGVCNNVQPGQRAIDKRKLTDPNELFLFIDT